MPDIPRGLFLSLDGIDGTGKSTQCRLLGDWLRLQGRSVVECADPGGTAIGKVIRELVLNHRGSMALTCEALLFMASRAQLVEEVIVPALQSGHVVVSDRFLLANVVYQGYAGGVNVELLRQIGRFTIGDCDPDRTIVLDLSLETAAERRAKRPGAGDRLESRDREFHRRVREGFLTEARRQPDRIRVVSAEGSIQEVHDAICREVADVLAKHSRS